MKLSQTLILFLFLGLVLSQGDSANSANTTAGGGTAPTNATAPSNATAGGGANATSNATAGGANQTNVSYGGPAAAALVALG